MMFLKIMHILFATSLFGFSARAQTYEVPVDNSQDAAYARFQLQDLSFTQEGSLLKIRYTLPLEITGLPNKIELVGKQSDSPPVLLQGEFGKATCDLLKSTCRVRYEHLQLDPELARRRLESLNLSQEELAARLSVGAQFRADPIGIVKFR